jgi:hypothetical protein
MPHHEWIIILKVIGENPGKKHVRACLRYVWGGQTDFRRNLVAVGPFVSSTGGWT